jgi:hypothetical protein
VPQAYVIVPQAYAIEEKQNNNIIHNLYIYNLNIVELDTSGTNRDKTSHNKKILYLVY